jgi:hypothetical protein
MLMEMVTVRTSMLVNDLIVCICLFLGIGEPTLRTLINVRASQVTRPPQVQHPPRQPFGIVGKSLE